MHLSKCSLGGGGPGNPRGFDMKTVPRGRAFDKYFIAPGGGGILFKREYSCEIGRGISHHYIT
jgi:hypothetical protein